MSENWVERFQRILTGPANEKAEMRQDIIDNITAMKLAGISREETASILGAELLKTGQITYASVYARYLAEVYGEEKTS